MKGESPYSTHLSADMEQECFSSSNDPTFSLPAAELDLSPFLLL